MAMRAVSTDFEAARLMAIDVNKVISFTFGVGSLLAALGGIMWTMKYPQLNPLMGVIPGLKCFICAVIGGIGNIFGAVLGGFLLGFIEIMVAAFLPALTGYRDAFLLRPPHPGPPHQARRSLGKETGRKRCEAMKTRNTLLTAGAVALAAILLWIGNKSLGNYAMRILNLSAIYIVLALSLNMVNGFLGLFSLGSAGFMAVGAYVSALLSMSPEVKEMNFFLEPLVPWMQNLTLPFFIALIAGGLCAALAGLLIGMPVLRLHDDYLAIATLGFGEIIRVVITNLQTLTNGAQGLKNIPKYSTTWTVWGVAAICVALMALLTRSSYGRQIKAVRDDEIAAEAMGVNVFRVKVVTFTISSFMAGVGGALLGHMITTIDPKMFTFLLSYNIVLIVVLGGNGSITGSVIAAIAVTVLMELMRFLDEPLNLIFVKTNGTPGLRMVVFSALLMLVIIFRQRGLMGDNELSWDGLLRASFLPRRKKGAEK